MTYVKGLIVLFVVLTILLHLPTQENYRKYIHFFAELILTMALLSPVLSIFCDSDEFLKLIEYETFTEKLAMVSEDMEHIEYLYEDYHREKYAQAVAEGVKQIAEEYDFDVQEAAVELSENYEVEHVTLQISESDARQIVIESVEVARAGEDAEEEVVADRGLKTKLAEYYGLEEKEIEIRCGRGKE